MAVSAAVDRMSRSEREHPAGSVKRILTSLGASDWRRLVAAESNTTVVPSALIAGWLLQPIGRTIEFPWTSGDVEGRVGLQSPQYWPESPQEYMPDPAVDSSQGRVSVRGSACSIWSGLSRHSCSQSSW